MVEVVYKNTGKTKTIKPGKNATGRELTDTERARAKRRTAHQPQQITSAPSHANPTRWFGTPRKGGFQMFVDHGGHRVRVK